MIILIRPLLIPPYLNFTAGKSAAWHLSCAPLRTPFLTIFRRTALGESGVGSKRQWWGGAKSDGLARRFCLRNQTQAAVLISVMVYSPTFKTICYYFIFPKKCKSVLYFLRRILWGGEGDLMEPPKYKIRAGGFPTSANLSMHSSLDLAQTGKPCNFLQNFAKAVHEDWELLKQKQLYFKRLILLIFILFSLQLEFYITLATVV